MGTKCSTIGRDEEAEAIPATKDQSKDTRFWHEKMRFSQASQALFEAAVRDDAGKAAQAVRSLGDPNCCSHKGYRPLQVAISCGHYDLVDMLLKAGANINGQCRGVPPPIVLAAGTGDLRVFTWLLDNSADVTLADDAVGETALTRASSRGHTALVKAALSRGSPGFQKLLAQRHRSSDGATALHLAAANGHRDVCDILLGVGSEPSVPDKRGRSSVHYATEGNHVETVAMLLNFGAAPSVVDKHGETALHIASAHGFLAVADLLLRYAADANMRRHDGRTPLHTSAGAGHDVVLRLLLSQGAEVDIEDAKGETAFALAFEGSHVTCCRSLLGAGAEVLPVGKGAGCGWAPPYTALDPQEHESMRTKKVQPPHERDTFSGREIVGC
eukprot:TRINITY_DN42982_c0_g1_i1.p1 TRINITY_DN42982_c0_g1~~TRINITY_DN42982_c0_g1_i1.p1  ORF type:complete len:386 (-),score=51.79 TRINITY_DN42982_c0_g1_i1:284-1441(-)